MQSTDPAERIDHRLQIAWFAVSPPIDDAAFADLKDAVDAGHRPAALRVLPSGAWTALVLEGWALDSVGVWAKAAAAPSGTRSIALWHGDDRWGWSLYADGACVAGQHHRGGDVVELLGDVGRAARMLQIDETTIRAAAATAAADIDSQTHYKFARECGIVWSASAARAVPFVEMPAAEPTPVDLVEGERVFVGAPPFGVYDFVGRAVRDSPLGTLSEFVLSRGGQTCRRSEHCTIRRIMDVERARAVLAMLERGDPSRPAFGLEGRSRLYMQALKTTVPEHVARALLALVAEEKHGAADFLNRQLRKQAETQLVEELAAVLALPPDAVSQRMPR
jgi:hypothetical protein